MLDEVLWAVPIGVICCAALLLHLLLGAVCGQSDLHPLHLGGRTRHLRAVVIGGAITILVVSRVKKIKTGTMLDIAAMAVLIGQIFGRWGNFMNREAHGAVTDSFFKMGLVDASGAVTYYHPTFLYESVWNLVGFLALHFLTKKRKFDGQIFLSYLTWYGLGRVWIEGLRTDSLYLFSTGIRVSQLVAALCVVIGGGALAFMLIKRKPDPAQLYVNQKAAREAEAAQEDAEAEKSENL